MTTGNREKMTAAKSCKRARKMLCKSAHRSYRKDKVLARRRRRRAESRGKQWRRYTAREIA